MKVETILFQLSAFVLAPLLLGIINRTKAIFAGRHGQPLLQPYYDIAKLLRKGVVYSNTTTWVFRAGPVIGLAAVATAVLLTPVGNSPAVFAFSGDVLLFIGLLGLARFFTVAAALDTGSSFEGMGGSREVLFSALAEPALLLGLLVLVLISSNLSLTSMLGSSIGNAWAGGTGPALALALVGMFLILLAENARIPVDDPNTHLELTMIHEVMVLDHSGPDFAYITYASALKLWVFATLLIGVALPVHSSAALANGAVFLAGMAMVAILIGIVESSMARLRLMRVTNLLITSGVLGGLGITLVLAVR